mmetsp:Transcript_4974/g.17440  ORF Transcript_4974/g.17440 Transcript_4974/m.17440 type:complete len:226 (+) Transcript_4974:87-764(+)
MKKRQTIVYTTDPRLPVHSELELLARSPRRRLCGFGRRVARDGGRFQEHNGGRKGHSDPKKDEVRLAARGPVSLVEGLGLLVPVSRARDILLDLGLRLVQLLSLLLQPASKRHSVFLQLAGHLQYFLAQVLVHQHVIRHMASALAQLRLGVSRNPDGLGSPRSLLVLQIIMLSRSGRGSTQSRGRPGKRGKVEPPKLSLNLVKGLQASLREIALIFLIHKRVVVL